MPESTDAGAAPRASYSRIARLRVSSYGVCASLLLAPSFVRAVEPGAPATPTPCQALRELRIPDVTVSSAAPVEAGSFTPSSSRQLSVPPFCRVEGIARPTADSEIRFEVWIPPAGAWNGSFLGVGTGGYDGSINYASLAMGVGRGFAVVSTDMGHSGGDLSFGLNHPEKVVDWAHRAIHVTTEIGKLIVRDHTGSWPDYSYFDGCSSGGHQALSEAQRFPADYDGILVGDPGNDRVHQTAAYLSSWLALHDADGTPLVTQADLQLLTRSAIAKCDEYDGVADGVLDDPRRCDFDPASLTCTRSKTDTCLTARQVAGAQAVYAGTYNPRTGEEIFPGWSLGSEGFGNQGWRGFLVAPDHPMRSEVFGYFVFGDPAWDWRTFDFDRDMSYADEKIGFMAAVDHDLRAFRDRGGKMIMYTGWADPVATPEDVLKYYEGVVDEMGGLGETRSFFKFYMVPGMGHCGGGYGPNSFDMLTELQNWVEEEQAPDAVTASMPLENGRERSRPLCPYPEVARWTSRGSSDDAENFVCTVVDP